MPFCLILVFFQAARCFSEQVFQDDFKGVEVTFPCGEKKLYPDPQKWVFTYLPGLMFSDSYGDGTNWLNANGECQIFVTPFLTKVRNKPILPHLRYDPFSINEDGLAIRASLLSKSQRLAYQTEGKHRRFGSGMLLSRKAFLYGKFRLIAKMPKARGSWPAFWLLPVSFQWPPEIDIFEAMAWGHRSQELHSGLIPKRNEGISTGEWYKVKQDINEKFFEYGLDWNEKTITVFFEGKKLWGAKTPDSMKEPMYMIITLTIGGNWPFNELQVFPIDCKSLERLSKGADLIQEDYPDVLTIKSVTVKQ